MDIESFVRIRATLVSYRAERSWRSIRVIFRNLQRSETAGRPFAVAARTDYTITSCVSAEWSYWRTDPGSWAAEEVGPTYGNLISDNRSRRRRRKPTWASEGIRTRRASLHVQRASWKCGKRINPRKGCADGKCSAGFICRLVVALPDKSWQLKVRIFYSRSR